MNERIVLTKEQAINMLPNKEMIHTFRQGGPTLIGADWDKKDLIEAINKYEVELTGEQARSMGHGMALYDEHGWLFIETKKEDKKEINLDTEITGTITFNELIERIEEEIDNGDLKLIIQESKAYIGKNQKIVIVTRENSSTLDYQFIDNVQILDEDLYEDEEDEE